ncbi:MAG: hypothetical protein JOZ51_00515 [Chloroflexi bacterium]|nr:hypothetical protein [Chloroflexota bacterium]
MPRFIRDNSLSLALLGLFLIALGGQAVTGWKSYNQEQQDHNQPHASFGEYLTEGHFIEAVFENWESEFLQDAVYVLFTAFLIQRGSAESKDPDKDESVDNDPRASQSDPNAPWPVRRGGIWLSLYKNSLLITFLLLFLFSFVMHAVGGAEEYSSEQLAHGGQAVSALRYMATNQFWFESLQNWQSEFLALFAMVVLSIFLRQQGSPESKPVASPHSETGSA